MTTSEALSNRLRGISRDIDHVKDEFALEATVLDELVRHSQSLLALSDTVGQQLHLDPLPPGMARVLVHVRQFIDANGYPPTRQQIADALGFSSANAAQQHLERLAQRGLITLVEGQARGIRLNKRTLSARCQT
jgi:LexA DNA binding domain-containing protein